MAISLVGFGREVYNGKDLKFEDQLRYIEYLQYIQEKQTELKVRNFLRKILKTEK